MQNKSSMSKQMIRTAIKKHIGSLIEIFVLSITIVILSVISPVIYQKITDEFIPDRNIKAMIVCIVVVVAIPIISVFITLLKNKVNYWFGKKCIYDITDTVFKKIVSCDFSKYSQYDSVALSNILTRSAEAIPSLYLNSIINTFSSIMQFVIVFVMLLNYNVFLTLATFIVLPLSYLLIKLQKNRVREASHDGLVEQRNFQKSIVQMFNGMKTIRSYNAQQTAENIFVTGLIKFNKAEWKFRKMECIAGDALPTALSQIVLGTVFVAGAFFVLSDKMSIGALVAVIAYLPSLMSSLNGVMKAKLSITSIQKTLQEFDDIMKLDDELSCSIFPEKSSETIISMKNVDFTYDRENFNLHIDDLTIKNGEFAAIVGTTGGGKSSFMDIINKYFPITSGTVTVFGKNINEVDTNSLRKLYSVVSQDVFMFNDTIEMNISFPEKPEKERISEAIEKAQLTEFIDGLPEHEKTIVSDFGANLSGGERQRISLARALYRDAPVMLLDEPTSALDAKTSKIIFDMLSSESKNKNKTIVVITHDIVKAMYADEAIVINDGHIVEHGKPKELIEMDGVFKSLFSTQKIDLNKTS